VIHPVDRIGAFLVRHGPQRLRIFPDGWGDSAYVAQINAIDLVQDTPAELTIEWDRDNKLDDRVVRDGHFDAPTDLPEQARRGALRLVEPRTGTDRLCVLMAAWNDHGYATRQRLGDALLARGIGSLLLENPYYGSRRIVEPGLQPVPTVADFVRMGHGAISEGRALLQHFRNRYTMGVSGYSMGGNVAALIGATAGFPVAIAPLAPSHSPGPVFLDGVLSSGIQWQALGGRARKGELQHALTAISVLRLPAPSWSSAAVLVAARADGFVPAEAVRALHAHWPGSELRWQRGGHATLLWRKRGILADAIADSFDRLGAR
jgi:hypothetical protein